MKTNRTCVTVLLGLALCFSVTAAAQTAINFNALPHTNHYLPIPSGYGGMTWGNLNYVTVLSQNVGVPAFGSTAQTISAANPNQPFRLDSLIVSAQSGVKMTVHGYNQGVFVGSQSYPLSVSPTVLNIPSGWGNVTSVTITSYTRFAEPALYMIYSVTVQ